MSETRDKSGRFLKGHNAPGPGRRPGQVRLDPVALMRDYYRSQDRELEEEAAKAMLRLINLVQHGDPKEAVEAAKVVLPLLVHKEPDAPLIEIDMRDGDASDIKRVPQEAGEIGDFIAKLHEVGEGLGLVNGAKARIEVEGETDDDGR